MFAYPVDASEHDAVAVPSWDTLSCQRNGVGAGASGCGRHLPVDAALPCRYRGGTLSSAMGESTGQTKPLAEVVEPVRFRLVLLPGPVPHMVGWPGSAGRTRKEDVG